MSFRRTGSLQEHETTSHVVRHQQPEHRGRARRAPGEANRRVQRAHHPDRDLPLPRRSRRGLARDLRQYRQPVQRAGLEVAGSSGAHGAAQHQGGELGPRRPRNRRAARLGRPRHVPLLLDAAVRAGRPLAVTERPGLRGGQRREHRDDPLQRRRGVQPSDPPRGQRRGSGRRQGAGTRRLHGARPYRSESRSRRTQSTTRRPSE